ncbi:MAG: hypothetical protein ACFFER_17275 [Candidatus Thorarchaeota archaeon]
MAEFTGTVESIRIKNEPWETSDTLGVVRLDTGDEFKLFWTYYPPPPSWLDTIRYSMWISLLEEALINNLQVTIMTPDDTSMIVMEILLHR